MLVGPSVKLKREKYVENKSVRVLCGYMMKGYVHITQPPSHPGLPNPSPPNTTPSTPTELDVSLNHERCLKQI
jgi:hypothetical protein